MVAADARITVDVKLETGANSRRPSKSSARRTESLNTVSAEVSQAIDKAQVDNLALEGRSYMELLTLVPGAVITCCFPPRPQGFTF